MKEKLRKILACLMLVAMTATVMPANVRAEGETTQTSTGDTIILYTNDVHCAIDDYSKVAAYKAKLEEAGNKVILVDAGDHIQGKLIGSLTEGSDIVALMNAVGYDYAVPGNHEFDYGMDTFLSLAKKEAKYKYLSANFVDLRTKETVFDAYAIEEVNGKKIAFVGICTPETYTKSTPAYFQDENGNMIYGFSHSTLEAFYGSIQTAVDGAKSEGADVVVAISHLGINGTTNGWKSTDVIANTTGIDVVLDAHTHEVINTATYTDKVGNDVTLSSTGTKLANIGQLTIDSEGNVKTELIPMKNLTVDTASSAYTTVQALIDADKAKIAYTYEVIGTSEVELTEYDPETGEWVLRKQETNLGDFVADAYRTVTGADVALVNSGGIRASVAAGEVTRKALMDINPWNNKMCVIEATGQQILDALEHGARLNPDSCGGFLQVSGLTYEVHNYIESPVILDENGSFLKIDDTKERRVKNVTIGGEAIAPEKTYTVAGNYYMLKQSGDGFTMFGDSKIVKYESLQVDSAMLIQYFTENLGGKITAAQYGNALGDGRITVYSDASQVPTTDTGDSTDKGTTDAVTNDTVDTVKTDTKVTKSPQTGDKNMIAAYIALMGVCVAVIAEKKKKSEVKG